MKTKKNQMKKIMASIICLGLLVVPFKQANAAAANSCASQANEQCTDCLIDVLGASVAAGIVCTVTGPAAPVCAGADAGVAAAAALGCAVAAAAKYALCELKGGGGGTNPGQPVDQS